MMRKFFRLLTVVLAAGVYGCNSAPEAENRKPLHIVQMCDPQLGMKNYQDELDALKDAVAQINQLKPDAVIVCGDLVNEANPRSFADFREAVKPLTMPLICVPGNHDIGNHPTTESMALYRKEIGPDHYAVDLAWCRVIVVNSMLWKFPADPLTREHDVWLKNELRRAAAEKRPVIIAGHCPLFVKSVGEKEQYFNVGLEKRRELLELFATGKVRLVLSGHTHTSFEHQVNGIWFVNGPTTSINFDHRQPGFNLLTLHPEQ